ncbi:DUF4358 domain-containing protein [Marasmitruncus massiliensis]|uniref:DUF4358 domain-containing protein n=1 Tax=Marasmitruncus massiliensis TaxID=1944642 RepID=UPI000C79B761|nr:DUF4358 domain-containing protein [Marasmitruncus massiliensis]
MKRTVTKSLNAVILSILLLTGCGSKAVPLTDELVQMQNGQSLQNVVDQIAEKIGMQMPANLDETALKELFYVSKNDIEEFAGKIAMQAGDTEQIVAVKANPKKKQAVINSLGRRLSDVQAFLSEEKETAENGQVVEKGNYVFLLILNDATEDRNADMEDAIALLNEAFLGES